MKNILKKNQVIIAALAIMIIVAGYLNFTKGKLNDTALNPNSQVKGGEVTDTSGLISDEQTDITDTNANASDKTDANANADTSDKTDANANADTSDKTDANTNTSASSGSEVGEAVLANNQISADYFISNKLKREQVRAQSETTLKEIINNANISDAQKQDAIDQMIELTSIKEKETVTEALLEAKGFAESLVTITDGAVEVVVNATNLTEQQMAQIEDVVKRKTGISAKNIVITPAKVVEDSAKSDTTTTTDDSTQTSTDADQEAGTK